MPNLYPEVEPCSRAVPRSLNMSRMAGRGLRCVGIGSLFSLSYFVGGPGGSEEEEGDLTTKNKYLDPIAANSEEEGGKEEEGPGDLLCVSREGIYRVSCRSRAGRDGPLKLPPPPPPSVSNRAARNAAEIPLNR